MKHLLVLPAMALFCSVAMADTSWLGSKFEQLHENLELYNQYNDSIFMIQGQQEWVDFIQRRAVVNQSIYEKNKQIIASLDNFFTNDSIVKRPIDYDSLRFEVGRMANKKGNDAFFSYNYSRYAEEYFKNGACPDSMNTLTMLYKHMSNMALNFYYLGNDTTWAAKGYGYALECLDEKNSHVTFFDNARLEVLNNMSTLAYFRAGVQPFDELQRYMEYLKQLLKEYADGKRPMDKYMTATYKKVSKRYERFEENMIRNAYLTGDIDYPKERADSLMRVLLERYNASEDMTLRELLRKLVVQQKLGDLTFTEALRQAMAKYEEEWSEIFSKGALLPSQLSNYCNPFFSLFYFIDLSDIDEQEKRSIVLRLCNDIEDAYSRRSVQQASNIYVDYLNKLTTYDRITKYLTPEERIRFLRSLNVSTQVTTYAHSEHVGQLARTLVGAIVKYEPQLLVGMLGCKNAKQVKRQKASFEDYIYEAALYHDLGKNGIITVVTNDARPLFPEEFGIIKRHPELGLKFLELSPQLDQYRDVMLGHHKWYNGEGGYPTWFDNTKSPYRTLIDIVTLCDCLQSATERVGRNYKATKSFDTALGELREGAGTRYNPDIFRFIDTHPDVAAALRESIEHGWRSIYYDIYSQFFEHQ